MEDMQGKTLPFEAKIRRITDMEKVEIKLIANGRIKYGGQFYDSPSTVGSVVRGGKATNG